MDAPAAATPKRHDRGWLYSLALHGLALLLLLWTGRMLKTPLAQQKPLIPVEIIFGSGGLGERAAAPQAARAETTPHPVRVRPQSPRPVMDPLDARLAALSQARAADTGLAEGGGDAGGGTGYTIQDLVRAQILRHWGPNVQEATIAVALHVVIKKGGKLAKVEVVDQDRFSHDAAFRDVAISLRNATTLSSPFELPPNVPASALDFTIMLSPHDALR